MHKRCSCTSSRCKIPFSTFSPFSWYKIPQYIHKYTFHLHPYSKHVMSIPFWLQPGCYLIFHQIQPQMFLKLFLTLETSSDTTNVDHAIVMKEKERSGFVRHASGCSFYFLDKRFLNVSQLCLISASCFLKENNVYSPILKIQLLFYHNSQYELRQNSKKNISKSRTTSISCTFEPL